MRSIWFFPAIVLLIACLLAVCKISGSSVGMYDKLLYGQTYHDKNLLFGQPQPIRSDEWLVVTPTAVAQTKNHLNAINPNIGHGEDLSVVIDTPHNNWVALFEPQNWPFFVMPVEYAFALKWWLILAALIISCYFFVLTLMPRQKWFAILVALGMAYAPYVQWWYQSITILSLAYGFLIALLLVKLVHSKRHRLHWSVALGYTATCFAFLQYPPFLIPVAITVVAFFAGHVLDHWPGIRRRAKKLAVYIGGATAGAIAMIGLFVATHAHVLQLIANTAYPGKRSAELLHLNVWELLGGFLNGQLQIASNAAHYFSNQSEASNFITLAPFLLIPSGYVIYRAFRRKSPHKYTLLFINIVIVLFSMRFLLQLNGGGLQALLRVVPNNRVLLGIGFACCLQLIILAREQQSVTYPKRFIHWVVGLSWIVLLYVGWRLKRDFPGFIDDGTTILFLASTLAIALYLFMKKRIIAAAVLLLAMSFAATYKVNPLYRGLGPLINAPLSHKVSDINNKKPGPWIVLDSLEFNTYLPAQGIQTISGVYEYPQFAIWHELDPTRQYTNVYNRYAQAVFSEYAPDKIYLVQSDMFHVKFNGCDSFVQHEASYILSVHPTQSSCLTHIDTLPIGQKTFYVYKTAR